jgi:hypothetical protein
MTPSNRIGLRSWLYVAVTGVGVLTALAAIALTLHARSDHDAAVRLSADDLVLSESVAETRTLVMELRLSVLTAALDPAADAAARYRSAHRRASDELRRVRLHAPGENTVDVADDLENSLLRLGAAADRVFTAAEAGHTGDLPALALAAEHESAHAQELAEELTTIATTVARERAAGIANTSRPRGLAILAIVAVILALEGGALAWTSAGPALVSLVTGRPIATSTPESVEESDQSEGDESGSAEPEDTYNLTPIPTGSVAGAGAGDPSDTQGWDSSSWSATDEAAGDSAA